MDAFGPLPAAFVAVAERRDMTPCPSCGNPEPSRLGDGGCEACVAFPRCVLCGRWTDLYPSRAMVWDGALVEVCDVCWEKAS
jgi:hypothetical protein